MEQLSKACLDQLSTRSAQQIVVFVTRQSLYKQHAKAVLAEGIEEIKRNSPAEKQEKRIKKTNAILRQNSSPLSIRGPRFVGPCAQSIGPRCRSFPSDDAPSE